MREALISCSRCKLLDCCRIMGSIHKIGALAQGLPACNGWTFWYIEQAGSLVLIDDLRKAIRSRMAA